MLFALQLLTLPLVSQAKTTCESHPALEPRLIKRELEGDLELE
jgi:hypothetical protein